MKDEIINLYVGCPVVICGEKGKDTKINLGLYVPECWLKEGRIEANGVNVFYTDDKKQCAMNFGQTTLLLRDLLDITDDEIIEIWNIVYKTGPSNMTDARDSIIQQTANPDICPEGFLWFIKHRFDLFQLIEQGYAFDIAEFNLETWDGYEGWRNTGPPLIDKLESSSQHDKKD